MGVAPPAGCNAAINARRQPGDAAAAAADGNPPFAPNAFIRIDADGSVRLVMPNVEMGQGIYTGACMMLAEELGVGMDQIKVEHAPPNEELYSMPLLGGQITGGSTSTRGHWEVLREAGAVARTLLVTAAAARWHVDPSTCTVARGAVIHPGSKRTLEFGALAKAAGALPMPDKVALKDPKDFTLIGKPLRRVDSADKVKGATQFGIDVRVPGMKIATVKACPTFGGKLVGINDKRTRAVPGVIAVLQLDDAVAVVGEHFWAAKQGLDALDIEWDLGENATLSTAKLREALAEIHWRHTHRGTRGRQEARRRQAGGGDLPIADAGTRDHGTAQYDRVGHGREVRNLGRYPGADPLRRCRGPDHGPARREDRAAQPIPGRRFRPPLGERLGGTGRSLRQTGPLPDQGDLDAGGGHSARHRSAHVSRPDFGAAGFPRTAGVVWRSRHRRYRARALGADGHGQERTGRRHGRVRSGSPYDIPNLKVEWVRHDMPDGLLVGWWRGVGPTHNLFVVESFIDELAHTAGKDPLEYRRAMLQKNPRTLALLNLAAEKIGWSRTPCRRASDGASPWGVRSAAGSA